MRTVDRYIGGRIIWQTAAILAVGLALLMSERLLRLLDLFSGADDVLRYLGRMLISLMPHYVGLVLPAAFFFAVLFTFSRLRNQQELSALQASGTSLPRLSVSVGFLAMGMACVSIIVLGYLQPHARYAYRSIKHNLTQASLSVAIREGGFLQLDDLIFFAESSLNEGSNIRLARIFVLDSENGIDQRLTTAREGVLIPSDETGEQVLHLDDGLRLDFESDGEISIVNFGEARWPLARSLDSEYRARGGDPRELTLAELITVSATPPYLTEARISAELNSRLVTVASTLALSALAVAMGARGARRGRDLSAFTGLVLLIVYNEALEFGESLVKREQAPAWLAIWFPFALLASAAVLAFRNAAFRPPTGRPDLIDRAASRLVSLRQSWTQSKRRRA